MPVLPITDAAITHIDNVTHVVLSGATSWSLWTASPIVVGDYVVVLGHFSGLGNQPNPGRYDMALLGYNRRDGKVYLLANPGGGEATPLYQPLLDRLYLDLVAGGSVRFLDGNDFSEIFSLSRSFGVNSDSSGLFLDGLYYFGSVNSPKRQNPIDPNDGGVFALDGQGHVTAALNLEDGFRSWIGAGITSDGQYLYVGGGPEPNGNTDDCITGRTHTYGCSVVKLDKELNIVASFDPGDPGCHCTGVGNNDEDAVAGEVTIAHDGTLWVQFAHGNDASNTFRLYHLSSDLTEIARFQLPGGPLPMTGYYQSPSIDREGNAWLFIFPNGINNRNAQLWKITPQGNGTLIATLNNGGTASPVLADDRYVLTVDSGVLQIRDLDGSIVKSYELAADNDVIASPMIVDGDIYVVDTQGNLTVIEDSGLTGYGEAAWPRYRHDNFGSGILIPGYADDAERILNAAEDRFPDLLPGRETTTWFSPYLYRHYEESGIYIGIDTSQASVVGMGGALGDRLVTFGSIEEIATALGVQRP